MTYEGTCKDLDPNKDEHDQTPCVMIFCSPLCCPNVGPTCRKGDGDARRAQAQHDSVVQTDPARQNRSDPSSGELLTKIGQTKTKQNNLRRSTIDVEGRQSGCTIVQRGMER